MNQIQEKTLKARNGMAFLVLTSLLLLAAIGLVIYGAVQLDAENYILGTPMMVAGIALLCIGWIPYIG